MSTFLWISPILWLSKCNDCKLRTFTEVLSKTIHLLLEETIHNRTVEYFSQLTLWLQYLTVLKLPFVVLRRTEGSHKIKNFESVHLLRTVRYVSLTTPLLNNLLKHFYQRGECFSLSKRGTRILLFGSVGIIRPPLKFLMDWLWYSRYQKLMELWIFIVSLIKLSKIKKLG